MTDSNDTKEPIKLGIPIESFAGECRLAASPQSITALTKIGFIPLVQSGAGVKANFSDQAFEDAGAIIVNEDVWQADVVLKVNQPTLDEVDKLKQGATLISFLAPAQNEELLTKLAEKQVNALAMESVPRISRAQSMDALSSMANIAGYRAVVEASHLFGRFFTGQITAAGKIEPAKVMVIGAGVAGLAAIGTAGSLGAIVRAFDTRPEVKEQIESMGAEFLELDFEEEAGSGDGYAKVMSKAFIEAEMALFAEQAKDVDIIITTAMIPGKPAPKLITKAMVDSMKPGSVVVDLAAAGGGNCEYTKPGEHTVASDVNIVGYTDLPSHLSGQSSRLYANNLVNLLKLLVPGKDGQISLDFEDDIIRQATVVKSGEVTWPPPPIHVSAAPSAKPQAKAPEPLKDKAPANPHKKHWAMAIGAGLFAWIASVAPADFLSHFTVFVLACIVGYHTVWRVTHALHTPLMSVTNAISGIIVVGALLQMGSSNQLVLILAGIAILIATINVVGGFVVTKRMLKMFRKED